MPEIEDLLKDRGSRYGDFGVQAQTARAIKGTFESASNWSYLPPYMQEGLDLVATKLSRMLCGDYMYLDNVVDIIGYMTLVKTEMEKEEERVNASVAKAAAHLREEIANNPLLNGQEWSDGVHQVNAGPFVSRRRWVGPYDNP